MKEIKSLFIILLLFPVVLYGTIGVAAMNTGFSTSKISDIDQQSFLSNIQLFLVNDEPTLNSLSCFDINNGLIALGSADTSVKYISVYDLNGCFKYGYCFNCDGDFGVQWDGSNLIVNFVRSDVLASFDQNGNCIEMRGIEDTFENNRYLHNSVMVSWRSIGNDTYRLESDFPIAFSYSKLVKIDENGVKHDVYNVGTIHLAKYVVFTLLIILFICVVVVTIIRNSKQSKNESESNQ